MQRALQPTTFAKPSIFISYKRDHELTANVLTPIENALLEHGCEIWRDTNIEAGAVWSNELYKWLMECSGAIALIGKEAAQSEWCRREWWFLRQRHQTTKLPVIPVSVDGSDDSAGILADLQTVKPGDGEIGEILSKIRGIRAARPSARSYLAAHHAWLRWQFNDAPMWGREPFSLREVYVETECGQLTWEEISSEREPRDPFKDDVENGGRHKLVHAVVAKLAEPTFRDLIVVQGPPGCGKSAFTLRLANELLSLTLHPILVRFRDFRLSTELTI
jgi:hypothetical protein